ncbi:MAG: DUF2378 family protein [Sorangiineae bacterium]|nr:DUF2378 family protein [Polyangiaceae bacterium]MEB2324398.1 DUF2378 family protein [Sorangiineae bacterium]
MNLDGFAEPNIRAPLELEARIAKLPSGATVKGMFLSSIAKLVEGRGGARPGRERYLAFSSYPLREMLELLPVAAERAYPGVPVRDGMRRLGRLAYPTFTASTLGRVVMSVASNEPLAALKLAPKSYALIGNTGSARVVEVDARSAILELRGVWGFPEAYNVGVHEGALDTLGVIGEVLVRVHSLADVDLLLRWRPRS